MKSLIVCAIGSILTCAVGAQDPSKPVLRKGVSVQMAVASGAVEVRAADEEDATVIAVTASGELFVGVERTEPGALGRLSAATIYVKADARVPFQKVLTMLDALKGKSVVLLTTSPANAEPGKIVAPYGIKLVVSK